MALFDLVKMATYFTVVVIFLIHCLLLVDDVYSVRTLTLNKSSTCVDVEVDEDYDPNGPLVLCCLL